MDTKTELIGLGRTYPQQEWRMKAHKHAHNHEIIVVLGGTLQVEMENTLHDVHPGEMIIYPQDLTHEERSVGHQPLESIFVAWKQADPLAVHRWPRKGKDVMGRVQMLARWMHELWPPKSPEESGILRLQLALLLQEFHRSQLPAEKQLEMHLRRYLQDHLSEPLCLDDLAAVVGMTKYHFVRRFKAETGQSPMSYLRQMRIQNAQNILINTPVPIKTIALQVGLVDEYHFSRVFRRVVGQSPRAYRKETRKEK